MFAHEDSLTMVLEADALIVSLLWKRERERLQAEKDASDKTEQARLRRNEKSSEYYYRDKEHRASMLVEADSLAEEQELEQLFEEDTVEVVA